MIRFLVSSSRIRSVGWDNSTLEIEFKNGKIYQYFNVSENEYKAFINAPSLGRALLVIEKTHKYLPIN